MSGLLGDISSCPTPPTHPLSDSSSHFLQRSPIRPIPSPILAGVLSCPSPPSHPPSSLPAADSSFPAPPPPLSSAGPVRRRTRKKRYAADNVVQAYPKALENQRRGDSSADAIKGAGLPKSTFYKWKPIAELLLVDDNRFDDPDIKPSELLASCKAALNDHRLKTIVKDMRSSGGLLK